MTCCQKQKKHCVNANNYFKDISTKETGVICSVHGKIAVDENYICDLWGQKFQTDSKGKKCRAMSVILLKNGEPI